MSRIFVGGSSLVVKLPRPYILALKALSARTRVRQSEYLREAVRDLLRTRAKAEAAGLPPREVGRLLQVERVAIHVLLAGEQARGLERLSVSARISIAALVEEALGDLLQAYSCQVETQTLPTSDSPLYHPGRPDPMSTSTPTDSPCTTCGGEMGGMGAYCRVGALCGACRPAWEQSAEYRRADHYYGLGLRDQGRVADMDWLTRRQAEVATERHYAEYAAKCAALGRTPDATREPWAGPPPPVSPPRCK